MRVSEESNLCTDKNYLYIRIPRFDVLFYSGAACNLVIGFRVRLCADEENQLRGISFYKRRKIRRNKSNAIFIFTAWNFMHAIDADIGL